MRKSDATLSEVRRYVEEYAQSALKGAILINGGAAAALLAFFGVVWSDSAQPDTVIKLAQALSAFAFGVLAAAMSAMFGYVTQYFYYCENQSDADAQIAEDRGDEAGLTQARRAQTTYFKWAFRFHWLALIFVIGAYVFFLVGVLAAHCSFVGHLAQN
ncbi:MAG: hypothetical protein OXF33_02175 [Rhodospirillales bacterium]|nr:hypothetical protein [Rhodospirillales bacterium]